VKLLFDQNLSPRLVGVLADLFVGSLHVAQVGLARADDDAVWRFAKEHGFAIVSKDSDFQERSQLAGSAPRIVWVRRGNCSTQDIEALLRKHAARISALESDSDTRFVVLL
jgi:predicted nuclease of predicted toxin-antitoxin system